MKTKGDLRSRNPGSAPRFSLFLNKEKKKFRPHVMSEIIGDIWCFCLIHRKQSKSDLLLINYIQKNFDTNFIKNIKKLI